MNQTYLGKKNDDETRGSRRHFLGGVGLVSIGAMFALPGSAASDSSTGNNSMIEDVLVEMRETRDFLANWFAGKPDKPARLEDFYLNKVLADEFYIVRPDGRRLAREQTLKGFFEKLYNSDPTVLRHDNDNIRPVLDNGHVAVVGYDETHVYSDHAVTNALTAVFLKNDTAPHGVSWLVVHETPINKPIQAQ